MVLHPFYFDHVLNRNTPFGPSSPLSPNQPTGGKFDTSLEASHVCCTATQYHSPNRVRAHQTLPTTAPAAENTIGFGWPVMLVEYLFGPSMFCINKSDSQVLEANGKDRTKA